MATNATQQYKVSAPGAQKHITATYHNGELFALEGIHHLGRLWNDVAMNAPIPLKEEDIPANMIRFEGLMTIEKVPEGSVSQKIAKFCAVYRHHLRIAYQMRKGDTQNMESVPVTDELLEAYFTNKEWWGKQPKSIRNYATNINNVLQLAKKKAEPQSEHPSEYDAEYERTLSADKLPEYWKHLRANGWTPKRGAGNQIIGWTKKTGILILLVIAAISCMTPNRVQRYVHEHPELFPERMDTVWQDFVIEDTDTVYVEEENYAWQWYWNGNDTVIVFDTARTQGRLEIQNLPTGKRINLQTTVKADTIVQKDTIEVTLPGVNTTVTISKRVQNVWWWIALGAGLLLILVVLWRRRK